MGICVWSPRLDEHGNSVRGIEFCRRLVAEYNVHAFDSLVSDSGRTRKRDPRRKKNQSRIENVVALTWAGRSQGCRHRSPPSFFGIPQGLGRKES
jgi:glutaminase